MQRVLNVDGAHTPTHIHTHIACCAERKFGFTAIFVLPLSKCYDICFICQYLHAATMPLFYLLSVLQQLKNF